MLGIFHNKKFSIEAFKTNFKAKRFILINFKINFLNFIIKNNKYLWHIFCSYNLKYPQYLINEDVRSFC